MALQATGPIKYSEIEAEFGRSYANQEETYDVLWVKWNPQAAWVLSRDGGGNASTPNWSQFMVDYAVYPSNTNPLIGTHTAIWRIGGGSMSFSGLPADTYTLECQSDNNSTFTWDDTFLGSLNAVGSETTSTTFTINNTEVTEHYLTASVTNIDNGGGWASNPAGVAWQLKNSAGTIIRSSTDPFNYDHASTSWGSFLNTYAVYPSTTNSLTDAWHETTYLFNTNSSSTYDFEAVADNQFEIYLYDITTDIETLWMNSTGNESCNIGSCNLITGAALDTNTTYRLRVRVYNGSTTTQPTDSWLHNPGGVGFTIKDSSGTIIKSSLDTGFQGSITTSSGSIKFGNYRMNNSELFNGMMLPLDTDCGRFENTDIPIQDNPISFSNFYNARLNLAVNYYSIDENLPSDPITKYANPSNVKVVGQFKDISIIPTTNGSKVVIAVNKTISGDSSGSNGDVNTCSLKTGSTWAAGTRVRVHVGPSGRIIGAGGDGGAGGVPSNVQSGEGSPDYVASFNGVDGQNGTSALGLQYGTASNPTVVKVKEGGRIIAGFGGGGGGAAARETSIANRASTGGGGGGGAGSPAGAGGAAGVASDSFNQLTNGSPGNAGLVPDGSIESGSAGGAGGACTDSCETQGGQGGVGRDQETIGISGEGTGVTHPPASLPTGGGGQGGQGNTDAGNNNYEGGAGGDAGSDGAAIRNTTVTYQIQNDGMINGETTATGVS